MNEWFNPTLIAQFLNFLILIGILYKFFKWCFSDILSSKHSKKRKNDDDDDMFYLDDDD